LGINKNISADKKDAALEVIKYYTSKEYQRDMIGRKLCISAVNEFLDDEELCKSGICDIAKNIQFTVEPEFIQKGPNDYHKKCQKYIYHYLYGENITINEALKNLEDIKKNYYVSLNIENSYVGLIWFILFSVISTLMLLSLIYKIISIHFSCFYLKTFG